MDYMKIIKEWLTTFIRDKQKLNDRIISYNAIESNIYGGPIQYDQEKLSATNKISSSVETNAIMLATIAGDIERLEYRQAFVLNAIDKLSAIEKQVIEYRYMHEEYMTWREIGDLVNRTERQCINIRDRAVEKMERNI